ncbi:hypothetical protein Q3G72_000864 [Acer saccharum]|nr:hypothetical protein Q3G72_000864 [Acer saccharum]
MVDAIEESWLNRHRMLRSCCQFSTCSNYGLHSVILLHQNPCFDRPSYMKNQLSTLAWFSVGCFIMLWL